MYKSFEELIFKMSRADGNMTPKDFKDMSVYDFYRYKELLKIESVERGRH